MRKYFYILISILVGFTSCTCYDDEYLYSSKQTTIKEGDALSDEVTEQESKDLFYMLNPECTEEEAINTGITLIKLSDQVVDLYLPQEYIDAINNNYNNRDLHTIVSILCFLDRQPVFGDTIAESWLWEQWLKMFINQREIFDNYLVL